MVLLPTLVLGSRYQHSFVSVHEWGTCHVSYSTALHIALVYVIRPQGQDLLVAESPFTRLIKPTRRGEVCSTTRTFSCRRMRTKPSHRYTVTADVTRTSMMLNNAMANEIGSLIAQILKEI